MRIAGTPVLRAALRSGTYAGIFISVSPPWAELLRIAVIVFNLVRCIPTWNTLYRYRMQQRRAGQLRRVIKQRPAVQAGVDLGKELRRSAPPTDDERRILFNQDTR